MSTPVGKVSMAELQATSMQFGAQFIRLDQDSSPVTEEAIPESVKTVLREMGPPRFMTPVPRVEAPPPTTRWQRIWKVLNMDVRDVWALLKGWYGRR